LYSDDLAEALIHLMTQFSYRDIGEFVNIGVGTDITIKALAESIRTLANYPGEIRFDVSKPDGTPRKVLDISKIKALGWAPTVLLDDGLKRLYEWYLRG
jgi:GDP-L-fucose synthase